MCYEAPGPRCSAHTWAQHRTLQEELVVAERELGEAAAALKEWGEQNPDMLRYPPVDLTSAFESAKKKVADKEYEVKQAKIALDSSPFGIQHRMVEASIAAGEMSPSQIAEYAKAKKALEAIYEEHRQMVDAGIEPSKEFAQTLKAAEQRYRAQVKESAALTLAKAGFFMSQNPEKYGFEPGKPISAGSVDVTNPAHATGIMDYYRSAAASGKMRDPKTAGILFAKAQMAAVKRAGDMRLLQMENGAKYAKGDDYDAPKSKTRTHQHRDIIPRDERAGMAETAIINSWEKTADPVSESLAPAEDELATLGALSSAGWD